MIVNTLPKDDDVNNNDDDDDDDDHEDDEDDDNDHLAVRVIGKLKAARQKKVGHKLDWVRVLQIFGSVFGPIF